jgi:hypothetical protein
MSVKRRALPPSLRAAVWARYVGNYVEGRCWCCERSPINAITNVEYGHVIAFTRGGADSVDNLRPICASCNKSMQTRDMLEYKRELMASFAPIDTRASSSIADAIVGATDNINISVDDTHIWAILLHISSTDPEKIIGRIRAHKYKLPSSPRVIHTFGPYSRAALITFLRQQPTNILSWIFNRNALSTSNHALSTNDHALSTNDHALSTGVGATRESVVAHALSCVRFTM